MYELRIFAAVLCGSFIGTSLVYVILYILEAK